LSQSNKDQQDEPVIHWRIGEWFPDLSPDLKTSLKAYHKELFEAERAGSSLVSAKSLLVSDALHFADSIYACRLIHGSVAPKELYDFGSGAGFPGMIYALLYPTCKVVLVESDKRKAEFLGHIALKLKAKNVEVVNQAVETLKEGSVTTAMCRGFSSISKTLMSCRKVIAKGGVLLHLKGEEWGMEVGQIPTQLCSIWSPSLLGEYKLPIAPMKFSVVRTDKIA
jgi:16S rRNA (guanine527-N7)-methyltransferase